MEGRDVRHNFEKDLPNDHHCQVWFNLLQWFQGKVYDLRWKTNDGKSSHGLWSDEVTRGSDEPVSLT